MLKWRVAAVAALVLLSAGMPSAWAQHKGYPDRTIRIIVPFGAGGGVDLLARMFAEKAQAKLGVSVIVENRGGGSGTVGGNAVMQSPPDGYTLLFAPVTHVMANQVLADVPYNAVTDFVPVARVGEAPMLVVMSPKMPQKTLSEVVAAARQNPKDWTVATSGLGSGGHIAALELSRVSGTDLTIAPYRGTAPALTDVMGGHVQILIDAVIALLPAARDGKVKGVAMTTPKRSALAPEIPTAAESGIPTLDFTAWYGFWGPKGLPSDIVNKLNAVFSEAGAELDKEKRLAPLGIELVTETPAEFARYIDVQVQRNSKLLESAKFKRQ